jgi:hypothetical protein
MLYIEENYFARQIALLEYFLSKGGFDVIVWLYPESRIGHLFGFELLEGNEVDGLAITKYGDTNISRKRTLRKPLDKDFIDKIKKNRRIYTNNCDSCLLYKFGENNWYGAAIGHEGIFLVRDDAELISLVESGFSVSKEKPDWW